MPSLTTPRHSKWTRATSTLCTTEASVSNALACSQRYTSLIKAIKDFTLLIEKNKDNIGAFFNRGCCYDSLGETDFAISDYSAALEIEARTH